jgi:hypothetical protein
VDDNVQDGKQQYRITIAAATSTDPKYNGIDVPDLVAINIDNDLAGITVKPPTMPQTTEKGVSTTFAVELNSQPTAAVTIRLTSTRPAEGTVSPAALTFSTTDWNAPQIVTVTGVNDNVADGNQPYAVVTQPSTSTDPNYNDVNAADVSLVNIDDDSPGFVITPSTPLTTSEDGLTATFTVQLQSQPVADVSIGVHSSDTGEGRTDVTSLTFTAANYNAPHTVTITGVDDAVQDANQAYRIILDAATSTDPNYNGMNPVDVLVTNNDNDSAGIIVMARPRGAPTRAKTARPPPSPFASSRSRAEPTPAPSRSPAATRPKAPSCSLRSSSRPRTGRPRRRSPCAAWTTTWPTAISNTAPSSALP